MPSILASIRPIFERNRSNSYQRTLELPVLEDILIKHLTDFTTVLILIDAVNESSYLSSLISSLCRLMVRSKSLRILVTSTADAISLREIDPVRVIVADMQAAKVQMDIAAFVEYRLRNDQNLCSLSGTLKDEIRAALLRNANGS
jgi:hypothetical protein